MENTEINLDCTICGELFPITQIEDHEFICMEYIKNISNPPVETVLDSPEKHITPLLQNLSADDEEYKDVIHIINNKNLCVSRIFKIKNPKLEKIYHKCIRTFRSIQILPDQMLLFHGTSSNNPKKIYTDGFNTTVANRGTLGKGIYFAEKISLSLKYIYSRHGKGYILLSKVVLGILNKHYKMNSSIYNDNMYIVGKGYQALPVYMIEIDIVNSFDESLNKLNTYTMNFKKNHDDEDYDPTI